MITYKILPGDNLTKIRKKLGIPVSIDDIVKANPIIKDPDKIQTGWTLKLPETYDEIKVIKTMVPTYKEEKHPEGFAPIIGPKGKEWVPTPSKAIEVGPEKFPKNPLKKALEAGWKDKEIKTKPITWKEVLPYFPNAFAEFSGVKPFLKPFA